MNITRTGRAFYEVESESENIPHQVGLEANDGLGSCTCYDFKYRCYPNYLKAKILGTDIFVLEGEGRTLCKHLKLAHWEDHKAIAKARADIMCEKINKNTERMYGESP